jgi:hypothetical protein
VPEPLMAAEGARIMDLRDPRKKMSKSTRSPGGLIRLIDSPEEIHSKIASATTDSGHEIRTSPDRPGINNLIAIYALVSSVGPEHIGNIFSRKTAVAVRCAHHRNLHALVGQTGHSCCPFSLDRSPSFEFETEFEKETNCLSEVFDNDPYVVHPFERHVPSL